MNNNDHKNMNFKKKDDLQRIALERAVEFILTRYPSYEGFANESPSQETNDYSLYLENHSKPRLPQYRRCWFTVACRVLPKYGRKKISTHVSHYNPRLQKVTVIKDQFKTKEGTKWYTYNRKTCGLVARGIEISEFLSMVIMMIHEITHAIQHHEGRKYGEVETTLNEIAYMRIVSPETVEQMEPATSGFRNYYKKKGTK